MSHARQGQQLRVFVAGLAHETNSFSPLPTSLRNFRDTLCYRPKQGTGRDHALGFPGYGDAIRTTQKRGDVVIEGPCFWTQPSGPASMSVDRIARQTVYCNAPGALNLDLASMPYRKVRLTRRGTAVTVEAP